MIAFLPGGLIPPPSPFSRSSWQRFREDGWPALRAGLGSFWRGPYRNFVLTGVAILLVLLLVFSLRKLEPVAGVVVQEGGASALATEVQVSWYLVRVRGFENELRPLTFTWDQANDAVSDQAVLRSERMTVGGDGRFHFEGGWRLGWPGWKGPFLSVHLRAADRLSGKRWPVPRFRLADGSEVAGGFDSALAAGREVAGLIARLELLAPRILDLAVRGDRVATAEGIAGVRLYRRSSARSLELLAHRPGAEGLFARAVGFLPQDLAAFTNRGFEILDPRSPGLETRVFFPGPERMLVGTLEEGAWIGAPGKLERFPAGEPLRVAERLPLGDAPAVPERMGPDVLRLDARRLFYLHSEGSVRLVNLASAFRTPATLLDRGGPILDFDLADQGRLALVASKGGVTVYAVARPETIDRLGEIRLALSPLAVRDRAVLGAEGIAVLRLGEGAPELARTIELRLSDLEAQSAFVHGEDLLVPWLGEPGARAEEREVTYDPLRGTTEVRRTVLRDSVEMLGIRRVDLLSGSIAETRLRAPLRLRIREDGLNRRLVFARFEDGSAVYARADGLLVVDPWVDEGD